MNNLRQKIITDRDKGEYKLLPSGGADTTMVDEFYGDSKNYHYFTVFLMNKFRMGDKKQLPDQADAKAVLHNTYLYHRLNPHMFNEKYIKNKMIQMRQNFLRDEGSYRDMEADALTYAINNQGSSEWGFNPSLIIQWQQNMSVVQKEIDGVPSSKSREVLKSYLSGKTEPMNNNERSVVRNFKRRMEKKYGT